MICCTNLSNHYTGKAVKDIPELQARLEEVATDYKKWVTTFRCSSCGQAWIEQYKSRGHGEVPEVFKQTDARVGSS